MNGSRDIWNIIFGDSSDDEVDPVDLDPELRNAVVELNGVHHIHHPALCEKYNENRNRSYNAILRQWKKKRQQAREGRNWRGYVDCHEKAFWADALIEIKGYVPVPEWALLVREAWVYSDELWNVWPKWRQVFSDRADFPGFMAPAETDYLAKLDDPISVYRGCRDIAIDGLSWTTDWDAAQYFEYQVKPRYAAMIIEGRVSKADVFAFVDKNEEFEIIAFPEGIVERKVLKKGGRWVDV